MLSRAWAPANFDQNPLFSFLRVHAPVCLVLLRITGMGTAADRRPSVAFLTSLADNTSGSNTPAEGSNQHVSLSTSTSTLQAGPGYSESGNNSNSRVETLSRDSRRGRDVKSAEIDLVRYQPLPGSVRLASVTEKVCLQATSHSHACMGKCQANHKHHPTSCRCPLI